MAIVHRILARLPQGFMRFDYPREKKEWKQYVKQHGGEVLNLGGGAFQARIDGRLCGWWNPSTKSAWVDFDVRWGIKSARNK